MKKLLILFLVVGLFSACNNNGKNPFAKKTDKEKTEEASDENGEKKKKGGLFVTGEDNDENSNSKSSWTKSYRDEMTAQCEEEMDDDPQGKAICACAVNKLEKKYPDPKDATEYLETVGRAIVDQCKASVGGNTEDRYQTREIDATLDEGTHGKSWTNLQRQQYIQGCETTGKQNNPQGYTAQQINSYCDCMTRKVERKYSFQQASRMTTADFQTQEWQSAAADCLPRY